MDADVRFAVSISHLHDLPPEVLDDLLVDAVRSKISAGTITHRERDDAPHLELVVAGVVRAFVTAPDGRTLTIRYCRPGALMGALSLFSEDFSMPGTTQALVDAELLKFSSTRVRHAAERDVRVARALLIELSERAQSFLYEIPGSAFASVRQRVARHLLDLASTRPHEGRADSGLVVPISQQELAAAAGTVREVVVRELRRLREIGAVRTERDRIVILDPAILTNESGWNSSS